MEFVSTIVRERRAVALTREIFVVFMFGFTHVT